MRFFLFVAIVFMAFGAKAQNDFSLTIDGKTIELSTDKPAMMMIGGKSYSVSLKQKDTLTFVNNLYSFNYPKDFKVNKKELGNDIDQVMLITAEG